MFQLETISPKMLDYYVGRRDAFIIDLRESAKFSKSHIKGAVNMPYDEFNYEGNLPKEKILVLYCDRGNASLLTARELAKRGFKVRSVTGGFSAYRGRNLVIS